MFDGKRVDRGSALCTMHSRHHPGKVWTEPDRSVPQGDSNNAFAAYRSSLTPRWWCYDLSGTADRKFVQSARLHSQFAGSSLIAALAARSRWHSASQMSLWQASATVKRSTVKKRDDVHRMAEANRGILALPLLISGLEKNSTKKPCIARLFSFTFL